MATMPSWTKTYHHKAYPAISPSRSDLSAKDKVILITGAGTGVGESTVHAFADANAKAIAICGRRIDPLNKVKADIEGKNSSTKIVVYSLDITGQDSVNRVFDDFTKQFGPLDVVVNSAGHISDKGTLAETSLANFWDTFEITCKGGFLIAQAFLNHYNDSSGADPVFISMNSLLAHFPAPQVKQAPASYASSKMAQGKMVEYVASENEGKLRAYNVHPGSVVSAMSTKSVEMSPDPEATRKGVQWDHADLPAHFCVWLASAEGRCIPSGKYLWAHWDVDELKQRSKELFDDVMALTLTLSGWIFPQPEVVDK